MRAVKPILLLLAVAGLSMAREAPGPEVGFTDNTANNEAAGEPAGLTGDQWLEILAPVLVSARPQ
ncbi:MAG: hypothetical protein IID51_08500 [Proteobacteria bacterium]|nr:hypothetical protein [Pseudomonadota bacterium]